MPFSEDEEFSAAKTQVPPGSEQSRLPAQRAPPVTFPLLLKRLSGIEIEAEAPPSAAGVANPDAELRAVDDALRDFDFIISV